jgi:hypothetical protein
MLVGLNGCDLALTVGRDGRLFRDDATGRAP